MRNDPHLIELLILEVKKNPILYDTTLPEYKNTLRKKLVWQEIADEIGGKNGETVSWKWKNLRDSYSKHLKNFTGFSNEANHKLIHWRWASCMSFLDPHLRKPKVDMAVGSVETKNQEQISHMEETNANDLEPPIKHRISNYKSPEHDHEQDSSSCDFHSESRSSDSQSRDRKRRFVKPDKFAIEPYHEQSSSGRLDKIDYLFLNYAVTFKKLSPRRQVLLKLKMAEIFAKAELLEIKKASI